MMRKFDNRGRDNRGRGGFGGGQRRSFGGPRQPQKLHKAVCTECGQECEVPFEPTPGKAVRCSECFKKFRESRQF